jgi:phosphoribosylanthranilate isomerase
MYIKICGITKPEQGKAIASQGADGLGFICVKKSPRYVQPEQIKAIVTELDQLDRSLITNDQGNQDHQAQDLGLTKIEDRQDLKLLNISRNIPKSQPRRKRCDRIGVFLNAPLSEIYETVTHTGLNIVQLHGKETPQFCQELRSKLEIINPAIKLIKAAPIKTAQDLEAIDRYAEIVDILLLDAYDPKLAGGTGKTINWQLLTNFRPNCDWWLAGGLAPENIAEALTILSSAHPAGVDVSSGVERSPGDKDLDRVAQLIKLVRQLRHQESQL